ANIDISAAVTLQDVIEIINAAGVNVTASLNKAGNGLLVTDTTASGAVITNLKIENNGSNSATDLGIEADGTSTAAYVDGGDLDRQYISRATLLSELNAGNGVFAGYIEVTDANGAVAIGDLSTLKTVGEIITAFNNSGLAIEAKINTTGDGIMLVNTTGGGTITVEEYNNGTTAEDLGLLGNATNGNTLDGSFERVIEVDANDTLDDVITKIADSGAQVALSVINDGSDIKPYHLSIASLDSGVDGMMVIDTNIAGFAFDEISSAKDAILLYGSSDASPILISSSSNTFSNEIPGLSLTVNYADVNQTVTVNVTHDTETITAAVSAMVESYNNLNEVVRILTEYDTETNTPGLLFGESTVHSLMRDIDDMLIASVSGLDGGISQLYDIGIEYEYDSEAQKSYLVLDNAALADSLANHFEAVQDLMTLSTNMARSDRNASIAATNKAGAIHAEEISITDEGNGGVPGENGFEDDDDSLWSVTGARLGDNTDATGNIYLEATTSAVPGMFDISAYSDALMTNLVASVIGVDASTGNPETFNLTEENGSGLSLTVRTEGDLFDGDTVTINNLTTELTSVSNLINGNTSSRDFGSVNGYQGSSPVDNDEIILNLDETRPINQIVLYHIDSEEMPAADWAISSFDVEYYNTLTNAWETGASYQTNKSALSIITLPDKVMTNQIRITVHDTNAPDGLARLVEVEAYESEGVASQMRTSLRSLTDSVNGMFVTADDTITSKIEDIQASIDDMEERLEMKEVALIKEWAAMENALAELQAQSDFFSAQMNALNNNNNK
ncbi:MAG: flagellar filament capping protein FliD, partial [Planctomycetes bacterium]|nr:flagellar filament capping protein FliD [Planctomycetota bacterium]